MEEKTLEKRGSYPVQSPDFTPHVQPPEKIEAAMPDRLPRTIRAVRDNATEGLVKEHPRTLVICLDGTGDQFDEDNSNIVYFVSCLMKHTPERQVTYYQSGIGTYGKGGLRNGIGAAADMAVGSGLGVHICDAYQFLMENYRAGDKICLFGFSRGAYTVRCLAGMLHKVGLLPASNKSQVNFAYEFYKDDSDAGWGMSWDFKRTFCTDVNVYFVGVFDCVASVGFIPRKLPFSKSPTNSVHYFRHAMALDEHRAKFKVCQWSHQDPDLTEEELRRRIAAGASDGSKKDKVKKAGIFKAFRKEKDPDHANKNPTEETKATTNGEHSNGINGADKTNGFALKRRQTKADMQESFEAKFDKQDAAYRKNLKVETDALEVWFMGAHADIGGGSCKNGTRHMLSRIPLRWMIRQCFECDTGILFNTIHLAQQGIDVNTLYPVYQQPTKPLVGPPPALLEKYKKGSLAPLWRRATFLPIGRKEDRIKDAPTAEDLQYILPSESTENHFDAEATCNDQLKIAHGWWVLEFWPIKVRILAQDGETWVKKVRWNLGRYRPIRESEPNVHWTVNHMIAEGKYKIRCRGDKNVVWNEVA
ncbi:hypothetical protein BT63DRAFT_444260 [Microthyrium microscopicum]|uniref:T6SS Phospholipase effector Tle1-like catalytic domain-containing protein n=1 Tax=Microthyrium microscopicum TaxID=703497 RepID=A0A6A6TVD3_9PEZI|nr:hypothetical protein BT63DRAFT_444260 [Microthyrium microscopicum]